MAEIGQEDIYEEFNILTYLVCGRLRLRQHVSASRRAAGGAGVAPGAAARARRELHVGRAARACPSRLLLTAMPRPYHTPNITHDFQPYCSIIR